jgi:hypothetical protein
VKFGTIHAPQPFRLWQGRQPRLLFSQKENLMRKSLLSIVTAAVLLAGAGVAVAQTTTTTTSTWTNDQGAAITQYSTTQHYQSFTDPSLNPTVGAPLPSTVTVYPLPPTVQVPQASTYSYTIVHNHPFVVESTTRSGVHTWN